MYTLTIGSTEPRSRDVPTSIAKSQYPNELLHGHVLQPDSTPDCQYNNEIFLALTVGYREPRSRDVTASSAKSQYPNELLHSHVLQPDRTPDR